MLDYPALSFETDIATFVECCDIDAVVVLTPIHLNVQVALTALKAGKNVCLEKPIALTLQVGRDLNVRRRRDNPALAPLHRRRQWQ